MRMDLQALAAGLGRNAQVCDANLPNGPSPGQAPVSMALPADTFQRTASANNSTGTNSQGQNQPDESTVLAHQVAHHFTEAASKAGNGNNYLAEVAKVLTDHPV
jgi:hypothetical protein